jgi:hypothetical protein
MQFWPEEGGVTHHETLSINEKVLSFITRYFSQQILIKNIHIPLRPHYNLDNNFNQKCNLWNGIDASHDRTKITLNEMNSRSLNFAAFHLNKFSNFPGGIFVSMHD